MALENIYRFCAQYPLIIYPIYSIIQELPAHKRQVNGVKFSCDAKRVVSCGSDFYMKVIDLQTGTILFSKGKLPKLKVLNFSNFTLWNVTFFQSFNFDLKYFWNWSFMKKL